jgi:hypothetical protein
MFKELKPLGGVQRREAKMLSAKPDSNTDAEGAMREGF